MENKPIPTAKFPKITKQGSKAERQEALHQLGWKFQGLVREQLASVTANSANPCGQSLDDIRLRIYDQSLPKIISAYEALAELMLIPQAGGKPRNEHFSLAYELLNNNYKKMHTILKAKALVKALNMKLQSSEIPADVHGRELMTERVARECIWFFKICLPHEDFY